MTNKELQIELELIDEYVDSLTLEDIKRVEREITESCALHAGIVLPSEESENEPS